MVAVLLDARAKKISETMRARKLDNFKHWREEQKRIGIIKSFYPPLAKNGDLAELIGAVLGDGHIHRHERCESLRIVGSSNNPGFRDRYANLLEKIFDKKPHVALRSYSNAFNITIYQKQISERLGIPHGARGAMLHSLPEWIEEDSQYKIRFLRGLFEAEGSECHHIPTSTHKFFFANMNQSLLQLVARLVRELGFRVNVQPNKVQVSRKAEVQNLINLLEFRHYET